MKVSFIKTNWEDVATACTVSTTFPEHGIEYNIQILPSGENFGNHICNTDNVISLNKEIYCSNAMSEVTELKSFIYIYIFFYDYLGKM